jgi:hypothetical protein
MKRYYPVVEMAEHTAGIWCRWEDVDALLAQCEVALELYEREHARVFKPLDCQCYYCKHARAALTAIRAAREGGGA